MTWIALLRGINVGGHRKLPMADLRALCTELGWGNPRTYIQSGNLAIDTDDTDVAARLKAGIHARWGYDVPVVLRTVPELQTACAATPYADQPEKARAIVFLNAPPDTDRVQAASPPLGTGEQWRVIGRDLHLLYPNGQARTKMTLPWFETHLGVTGTARNWRTTQKLIALANK
jgi:uncharacterized protein (DUF1697 family)